MFSRAARSVLILIAAASMWRCGSSPTSPSGGGVKLQGVALQDATAVSTHAGVAAQSTGTAGKIVVTVQENPSLSVTVSGNGTFEIRGLPASGFTLVFTVNGVNVGQIAITTVAEGTTVKIVVKVSSQEVELVDLETENDTNSDTNDNNTKTTPGDQGSKTCMIEGGKAGAGIELEGNVDSGNSNQFKLRVNGNRSSGLVDVAASGASYKCNGSGKNGGSDCKTNLKPGVKVHVRGNLTSCNTSAASVTATDVMIQKD
jgi:hypothetical protein